MSVEALASSWARRENAPDGAVVVLHNEVSGRLRGGAPWTVSGTDSLLIAMVVRPDIDPLQEALLWLPASMAAADCLSGLTDDPQAMLWPDRVVDPHSSAIWGFCNVMVQLGPGRVDHAVFSLRVDLARLSRGDRPDPGALHVDVDSVIESYVSSARRAVRQLQDDPQQLLNSYTDRCALIGERVRVELLPRGEARGRAAAVDTDGFLVLESPTGMLERVAPATLKSVHIVAPNG